MCEFLIVHEENLLSFMVMVKDGKVLTFYECNPLCLVLSQEITGNSLKIYTRLCGKYELHQIIKDPCTCCVFQFWLRSFSDS